MFPVSHSFHRARELSNMSVGCPLPKWDLEAIKACTLDWTIKDYDAWTHNNNNGTTAVEESIRFHSDLLNTVMIL